MPFSTAAPAATPPSDRFEVLRVLGEGAGGVVYLAVDRTSGETVAVKTLRPGGGDMLATLRNEFRVVTDLHHPNLVQIRELVLEGEHWFLSMEYVPGVDFQQYVQGERRASDVRPFDEGRLRHSLAQLAEALVALHEAGRIHRDIKPSNVLVTPEGRVVVLDFGVALDEHALGRRADDGLTGTALYMAPEQVVGERIGPAADWYALGVMLYRALTGRLPFEGHSDEVMEAKLARLPTDPHRIQPNLPADLVALCLLLLEPFPELRPRDADVLARLGVAHDGVHSRPPGPDTRCVGREAQLVRLREAHAEASQGRPVTVLVEGESGIGKSVFARAFAEELLALPAPAPVLFGRCYEREDAPFKAFATVVDALAQHLRSLPDSVVQPLVPESGGLLPRVFPELGKVDAIAAHAAAPSPDPKETRRRTFAAFCELVAGVAALAPSSALTIVIDDLQWADRDSLELLAELARPPRRPRLLLVCTTRLAAEPARGSMPPPAALPLPGELRRVRLERLEREAAARVCEALCVRLDLRIEPRAVAALLEEASGHPMFLGELLRRHNTSAPVGGALRLDDTLRARATELPAEGRRLLEVVCLAGLPLLQETARQAALLDPAELGRALASLRAEHLVSSAGAGRTATIEPYHDRIREAVAGSLAGAELREGHARLAAALEQEEAPEPEMLSHHWFQAGDGARAAAWTVLGADRASSALAFERAARLYELAMRLYEGDELRVRPLRFKLAEALTNAGHWALAADHRLVLASEHDGLEALHLRRQAAEQLLCSGHFDRGARLIEELLRSLGLFVPRSPLVVILSVLVLRFVLRLRGFSHVERRAEDVPATELARLDVLASAGSGLALTDLFLSTYFLMRGALLALKVGEPHRLQRNLAITAATRSAGGRKDAAGARELTQATRQLAEKLGTPVSRALALNAEAHLAYCNGLWSEAKPTMMRAEALYREQCIGVAFLRNGARSFLYRILALRGDVRELEAELEPALHELDAIGDVFSATIVRAGPLVALRLAQDRPDLAASDLAWVRERLARSRYLLQHFFFMNAKVNLHLYEGEYAAAARELEDNRGPLRRSQLLRIATLRALVHEQRGRVALALGSAHGGRARLADVEAEARRLDAERMEFASAYAAWLRAGVAFRRGRTGEALAHAERAQQLFERTDMELAAGCAEHVRGHMLGGEGAELVRKAEARLSAAGVRNPARLAESFAPGWLR
jgi:predicted Ser/Thr protein kinase